MNSRKIAGFMILAVQGTLIVLFGLFAKYDGDADSRIIPFEGNITNHENILDSSYPLFQNIHVMIFVGFGFLMTFLKRYAFGALGFTFLLSSIVMQWQIICHGMLHLDSDTRLPIGLESLIIADVAAATFLISLGAVLGKISPFQLVIMAIIETALYCANEHIAVTVIQAVDAGGSMYVHAFGAYFGLSVSFILARGRRLEIDPNLESSIYQSDINSMIGTLFLWMFWPSFTAGPLAGDQKYRAIINTYLALTSSCVVTFALSSLFNKHSKFEMVHIQNATLAGGVAIGTVVNMMIHPFGALVVGAVAGLVSTVGYRYCQGFLLKKIRLHDTCGVNNLHGVPGILSGLFGVLGAALANSETYGSRLIEVFPTADYRSPFQQAGFQLLGLTFTLGTSICGGIITGVLLRKMLRGVSLKEYHNDETWWEAPEEAKTK